MTPLSCLLAALLVQALSTSAQTCYYPNGEVNDVDAPCPGSDLCCPLNWACLSNGLCSLDASPPVLERHTCTDRSWQSDECPDFCTYSEAGNEYIRQCEDGSYCCSGNGSFDCCDGDLPDGTDYFPLPDGILVGSITALSPSMPETLSSSSTRFASTLTTKGSSASTTTTTSSTSSHSSAETSTSAGSADGAGSESEITPAPGNEYPDSAEHRSSFGIGAIVGVAVGVSLLLLLCALVAFILWRRHENSKAPAYAHAPGSPTEIKYSDALAPGAHAPEIDSSPKAPTDGTSELYGSDAHVRSSTVSSMTAGARGHSPTSMVSPVASGGPTPKMDQIQETDEPAPVELWGGHVYRPYRPGLESEGGQRNGERP